MGLKNVTSQSELNSEIRNFIDMIQVEGKNVLVKPNLVSLDPYPYTTSLEVINTVIEYVKKKKPANITVADLPSADCSSVFNKKIDNTQEVKDVMNEFHQSLRSTDRKEDEKRYFEGNRKQIECFYEYFFNEKNINDGRFNYKIIRLDDVSGKFKYKNISIDNEVYRVVDLSQFLVINLPTLKLHTTTGFTGAIKNFYSLFDDASKLLFHKYRCVGKVLQILYEYLKNIDLYTFLDARKVPDSQQAIWGTGKSFTANKIIYGNDILEIDSIALKLLNDININLHTKDNYFVNFVTSYK